MTRASLNTIDEGRAVEKFDSELDKAINNCLDFTKEQKKKRVVTLKATLTVSPDREVIKIDYDISSKLVTGKSGCDQMFIDHDGQPHMPAMRQITLDEQIQRDADENSD